MKVVINKCYGGFGLSNEAIERCLELGMTAKNEKSKKKADFTKFNKPLAGQNYYTESDYKKSFRCDSRVIQAIEELKEKANGPCSDLTIINIPFEGTNEWEINEYDGQESISEVHQTWG